MMAETEDYGAGDDQETNLTNRICNPVHCHFAIKNEATYAHFMRVAGFFY